MSHLHDYIGVDYEIVFDVVKDQIPSFLATVEEIIKKDA